MALPRLRSSCGLVTWLRSVDDVQRNEVPGGVAYSRSCACVTLKNTANQGYWYYTGIRINPLSGVLVVNGPVPGSEGEIGILPNPLGLLALRQIGLKKRDLGSRVHINMNSDTNSEQPQCTVEAPQLKWTILRVFVPTKYVLVKS